MKQLTLLGLAVLFTPKLFASELDDPRVRLFLNWGDPVWSYSGTSGPSFWSSFAGSQTCGTGLSQSPIAIEPGWSGLFSNVTNAGKPVAIAPKWNKGPLQLVNNGHTIQVLQNAGNTVEVDGVPFGMSQFHFHSPSEHLINGRQFPLEIHFVQGSLDSAHPGTVVISVFVAQGGENAELKTTFANVPTVVDPNKIVSVAGVETDPSALLPKVRSYLRYEGSLTTPPCSESVHWIVLTSPISASPVQLKKVQEWMDGPNNRPIQPVNGRTITSNYVAP